VGAKDDSAATAAVATDVVARDDRGAATLGGVRLDDLLARGDWGTPLYVYDLDGIAASARSLVRSFEGYPHLVAYAVKANSAGPILRALSAEGVGADVVSGAELELALACGVAPHDIVYSGVAKTDAELDFAIAAGPRGILALQAESVEEIPRIEARARAAGRRARVSLRINPGIEADTHAYIATGHDEAKFGIPRSEIGVAVETILAADHVDLVGVGNHVGSQLLVTDEYVAAARMLVPVFAACEAAMLQGGRPPLELLDCGGGFGIDYGKGCPVTPADFVHAVVRDLKRNGPAHARIVIEPGRSLVGAHGVLLATVVMQKRARPSGEERRWLMIDAGMNDLIRPALYQALHRVEPIEAPEGEGRASYRVVGPVCESSDDFGAHELPDPPPRAVVIRDAGAYGFTMASAYNGRSLPTELFLSEGRVAWVLPGGDARAWIASRTGARSAT